VRRFIQSLVASERDPRYVFVLIGGISLFAITTAQVFSQGLFDGIERPLFNYVNNLPDSLSWLMYIITQIGGLGLVMGWFALTWWLINRRAAFGIGIAGTLAWFAARWAKVLIHRGRPQDFLPDVRFFELEPFSGYGFPSGHATFSAACAAFLYYQLPRPYRRWLLLISLLVGISRMYLGAHFPLDIVGGWALGAILGSSVALVMGTSYKTLKAHQLKAFLKTRGYTPSSLRFARVDARGSRPFFLTEEGGREYFGKIFGRQEHAADWLFKIFRFFRYKNLQAEEPYVNSRRNVEMESFAMLWAAQAGVRVPRLADLLCIGDSWLLLQEKVDGRQLNEHPHLRHRSLADVWRQVEQLHAARIAHRDLRAANFLVDTKGKAWMIDFGFAEVSARPQRQYMDNAELLMSMALVVGVKRTLDAAGEVLSKTTLHRTLPYLQKAVFSGATTKQLRHNKEILKELRSTIGRQLGISDDTKKADILRFNLRKVINIALLAVFFYAIVPQLSNFRDALGATDVREPEWLLLLAAASLLTYVFAGLVYVSLVDVPLRVRHAALVQLAASFVSKILPGGIASTGLNAKYLTRAGMEAEAASAAILTQGIIGALMFTLPLAAFLLLNGKGISELIQIDVPLQYIVLALLAVGLVGTAVTAVRKWRDYVWEKVTKFMRSLRELASPSKEVAIASLASLAITLSYIVCLYTSARVLDIHLSLTMAVLVYASAVIAKSAVPTPGGLGPLEVAMIATLIGLGIDKSQAFSIVIVYRLATFWLPIPLSLLSYRLVSSRKLI
jgi:uncharacterized protein (TIRG00374 family)